MTVRNLLAIGAGVSALLIGVSAASAAPIVDLYNTGVTDSGAVQANGSPALHYALIASPDTIRGLRVATSENGFPIPPWIGDNTTSAWIGPVGDSALDGSAGDYDYLTTFTIGRSLNAATASITGQWSVDNTGVDILLNGVSLGITNNAGFTSFTPFTINSGFVSGLNTLEFVVRNQDGPTGLRVEMTGTADALGTPEPATWAMMVLGFGLVGAGLRRKQAMRVTYA